MTIRGALNLTSVLLILCNLLFVFSIWVSKSWVENVQALEPRVMKLETTLELELRGIRRELQEIKQKIP